jgi:predicted methyltransferase
MTEANSTVPKLKWWMAGVLALLLAACASSPPAPHAAQTKAAWTIKALSAELTNVSRPQADRDRDADRKPASLMVFFGVQRGMTTADLLASGGFMTEVLSVTVGPNGKVYAQNLPPVPVLVGKALGERLASNRLPNVVRVDGALTLVTPNSLDFAITVMNLHDIYNTVGPQPLQVALKTVNDLLKPGAVFGVVDHVGLAGADNAKLHRMTKQQAIDVVSAAGFVLEAESNVLANPGDDHTKLVTDASIRGKTDQFILRFRKPK